MMCEDSRSGCVHGIRRACNANSGGKRCNKDAAEKAGDRAVEFLKKHV